MKVKWIKKKIDYDGTQLKSLYSYLNHGLLGNSIIAFRGSCQVSFEHMVDGEDLLEKAKICGGDMVHFIAEIFDHELLSGVLLQRLMASIVRDVLGEMNPKAQKLVRVGDDLYYGQKKLSISIATRSPQSVLIHFAVNVSTDGTPVPTIGLESFRVSPEKFALKCLRHLSMEFEDSQKACWKVRPVS